MSAVEPLRDAPSGVRCATKREPLGDLNSRYEQQATWTRATRESLFALAGIPFGMPPPGCDARRSAIGPGSRVLDIGCGTGAVARDALSSTPAISLIGVDIDLDSLKFAQRRSPEMRLAAGDAHALPFREAFFDAAFFHFVLLWLADSGAALAEAVRVTRVGGHVIAIAEPDHEARIDAPEEMEALGRLQIESIRRQGADTRFGRKLRALLEEAGLADVRFGVVGGEWQRQDQAGVIDSEWSMLQRDLATLPKSELGRLERLDRDAWEAGRRVLFVPTMYGMGRVG
jgi:SAM-dependent methyltransferase